MRDDPGVDAPPLPDLRGGAGGQSEDCGGPADEMTGALEMRGGVRFVGVGQVVDGHHQRHRPGPESRDEPRDLIGRAVLVPEVQVHQVGAVEDLGPLGRLQRGMRPPPGGFGRVEHRVVERDDVGGASEGVADVVVPGGHGADPHRRGGGGARVHLVTVPCVPGAVTRGLLLSTR